MTRPAANILAQKLVVALRGEWDEDVWRCLSVLVGVVEGSSGGLEEGMGMGLGGGLIGCDDSVSGYSESDGAGDSRPATGPGPAVFSDYVGEKKTTRGREQRRWTRGLGIGEEDGVDD